MSSKKAILHYFNGRGRAEIIRLTFAAIGQEWDQLGYTKRSEFENLLNSKKLLFHQLPLIEYDGKNLVQSVCITRYFARKGDLLGRNPEEELKIDMLFSGARDCMEFFFPYGFEGFDEVAEKAKNAPNALPRYLPVFEKALKDNGSNGYLVGSKLSLADLGLFEILLNIEEIIGMDFLNQYPEIQHFFKHLKSMERLSNYLNGPLRTKKCDEKYVNEVKTVLKF